MSFNDPDPLEQDMGIMCADMSPEQLVSYIKAYQEAFGVSLAVEGYQERAIFGSMQRTYGAKTAGKIVKWVFYKYHGLQDGQRVSFTSFSKGRKWWVDKMHIEMQGAERRQVETASRVSVGSKRLSDL